jgi:hypothetical protein
MRPVPATTSNKYSIVNFTATGKSDQMHQTTITYSNYAAFADE